MVTDSIANRRSARAWWGRAVRREASADELAALRHENAQLRRDLRRCRRGVDLAKKLGGSIAMGPGLSDALERWTAAYDSSTKWPWWQRIPRPQTIDVLGAYLRRRAAAGLLIASLAAVPACVTMILLWQQNKKMDQQIHLSLALQSTQLLEGVNKVVSDIHTAGESMCLLGVAEHDTAKGVLGLSSKEFDSLKVKHPTYFAENGPMGSFSTAYAMASAPRCWREVGFASDEPSWMRLFERSHKKPIVTALRAQVENEARNVSSFLVPYRHLLDRGENAPTLSARSRSGERGQILSALAGNRFVVRDFALAGAWAPVRDLDKLQIIRSDLAGAVLSCSSIRKAEFSRVSLMGADLSGAVLTDSRMLNNRLVGVDLRFANLSGAVLPPASDVFESRFDGAILDGARVPQKHWYSKVASIPESKDPYTYTPVDPPTRNTLDGSYVMRISAGSNRNLSASDAETRRREFCGTQEANSFESEQDHWLVRHLHWVKKTWE